MTCSTCKHCVSVSAGDPKVVTIGAPKIMQCRRFPPTATALLVPGQMQGSIGVQSITSWPAVAPTDVCGEHVPRLQ